MGKQNFRLRYLDYERYEMKDDNTIILFDRDDKVIDEVDIGSLVSNHIQDIIDTLEDM